MNVPIVASASQGVEHFPHYDTTTRLGSKACWPDLQASVQVSYNGHGSGRSGTGTEGLVRPHRDRAQIKIKHLYTMSNERTSPLLKRPLRVLMLGSMSALVLIACNKGPSPEELALKAEKLQRIGWLALYVSGAMAIYLLSVVL